MPACKENPPARAAPPGSSSHCGDRAGTVCSDPAALTLVLGVVYRTISRHLIDLVGVTRATGATEAVTRVQRFGSALNLNVHFQMLFRDGVYLADVAQPLVFRQVSAPEPNSGWED